MGSEVLREIGVRGGRGLGSVPEVRDDVLCVSSPIAGVVNGSVG